MSLTSFTPIYAGRSDGETEIRTKKHGKEFNGPSNDQLNKVENPDDYYETLDVDHPLALEWKRILGGLLQKELGVTSGHPWFLMFFPENYRLYKHNKANRDSSGEFINPVTPKGKPSNKAPEAYLYGYPQGRKRRYHTAMEFFPHFMWLMEGKSEDYADCQCKFCAGSWVNNIEPLPGKDGHGAIKKEVSPSKKETTPIKKEALQFKREVSMPEVKVVVKQPSTMNQNYKMPKPPTKTPGSITPVARPAPSPAAAPPAVVPTPLPAFKSKEQEQDAQYRRFLYRCGELTWFYRGSAWGLCVIIKRDMVSDPLNLPKPRYLVQPLSHPFHHPDLKLIPEESNLRPWLAWSAPSATHSSLAQPNAYTYNTVDWKAVLAGQFGPGDAEVDGSIFAAKQVDDSYTLLSPLSNNTTTTGERSYTSLYLGGELLHVGEPVRLRINQGGDIMVVHQILEKLKPNSTNIALAGVYLIGDLYRFTTLPLPQPPNSNIQTNPHLPARMQSDLDFRNSITATAPKPQISHWKLLQPLARVTLADVKGRWYESSVLLPTLHGADNFRNDAGRGEITDVGAWINGRGDANLAAGKAGTRWKDRVEALGRAVPPGTRIWGEEEGRISAGDLVRRGVAVGAGGGGLERGAQQQVSEQGQGDLSQFMDLDRMDEGFAPGFGVGGQGRL